MAGFSGAVALVSRPRAVASRVSAGTKTAMYTELLGNTFDTEYRECFTGVEFHAPGGGAPFEAHLKIQYAGFAKESCETFAQQASHVTVGGNEVDKRTMAVHNHLFGQHWTGQSASAADKC